PRKKDDNGHGVSALRSIQTPASTMCSAGRIGSMNTAKATITGTRTVNYTTLISYRKMDRTLGRHPVRSALNSKVSTIINTTLPSEVNPQNDCFGVRIGIILPAVSGPDTC